MKFVKFALLCAIAVLLFATPRASPADGWTSDGFHHLLGVNHGNTADTDTLVSAYSGFWPAASISSSCWTNYKWVGHGTSTALNLVVDGFLVLNTTAGDGDASVDILNFGIGRGGPINLSITDSAYMGAHAGDTYLHLMTTLYADIFKEGYSAASWDVERP